MNRPAPTRRRGETEAERRADTRASMAYLEARRRAALTPEEQAEEHLEQALTWERVSVQMLPMMHWRLKARAAQEQTHIREVLHRALVAYLQTPPPPESS